MPRDQLVRQTLAIPNGQSLSANSLSLQGFLLVGIAIPSTMQGVTISFQIGLDTAGPWRNFYQTTGVEKTMTVAVDQHILVVPEDFAGVPLIRIRTGTAGAPQVQSQETTFTFILRPI